MSFAETGLPANALPLIDFSQYDFKNGTAAFRETGEFDGYFYPGNKGNLLLLAPVKRATIRDMTVKAIRTAKGNPKLAVAFEFGGDYYAVSKDDTLTSAILRFKEERVTGHIKPGYYLQLTGDGRQDTLEAVLKKDEENVPLFNVTIDAIRLSRENAGMKIKFQFNRHSLVVGANDDAEAVEKMIPASERLGNIPAPNPQPAKKVGGFTI